MADSSTPRAEYILQLQEAIRSTHGCESRHVGTTVVAQKFGQNPWQGEVETFLLIRCEKAKRCYAWSYDDHGTTRIAVALELPPVECPSSAVKTILAPNAASLEDGS
jgi:hypothetical protein